MSLIIIVACDTNALCTTTATVRDESFFGPEGSTHVRSNIPRANYLYTARTILRTPSFAPAASVGNLVDVDARWSVESKP